MMVLDRMNTATTAAQRRLIFAHLTVAFAALFIGTFFGVLQALSHADAIQMPPWFDYYRMLTAHGVLLALVFTTFFITGLSHLAVYQTENYPHRSIALGWISFWVMTLGTVMAAYEILAGNASVLYTFYAPLKASPWFYVGAALLIVGTWFALLEWLLITAVWRREHPGARTPLPAFMVLANYIMWFLATIGVAIEVIFMLIPWAFGWVSGVDVLLARMLFWYFGHPLVYFWLLGAYLIWYGVVPAILKVPIFSDSLTRLAFILFIILSLPVGIHHEFSDPGIADRWKLLQTGLTLMVVIPSLMTAFALFATFEEYAAKLGKTGFFGIVGSLPWGDPAFAGIALAMLLFIFGGIGGILNASYTLDSTIHNTMWVVGHFHITVGGPVALTLLAATWRLLPALTGKRLFSVGLARAQVWLWFIGMAVMSFAMHTEGLMGAPRRVEHYTYGGSAIAAAWQPFSLLAAGGGMVIFLSVIAFAIVLFGTIFSKPAITEAESARGFTFALARPGDEAPSVFDRLGLWTLVAVAMVVVAYAGPFYQHFSEHVYLVPGMRTW